MPPAEWALPSNLFCDSIAPPLLPRASGEASWADATKAWSSLHCLAALDVVTAWSVQGVFCNSCRIKCNAAATALDVSGSVRSNDCRHRINSLLTRHCKSAALELSWIPSSTFLAPCDPWNNGARSHPTQLTANLEIASPSASLECNNSCSLSSAAINIVSLSFVSALWNFPMLRWSFRHWLCDRLSLHVSSRESLKHGVQMPLKDTESRYHYIRKWQCSPTFM